MASLILGLAFCLDQKWTRTVFAFEKGICDLTVVFKSRFIEICNPILPRCILPFWFILTEKYTLYGGTKTVCKKPTRLVTMAIGMKYYSNLMDIWGDLFNYAQ